MSRVLILNNKTAPSSPDSGDAPTLQRLLPQFLDNTYAIEVASLSELAYIADNDASRIWHPQKGWDVADFDLVIFRRVGDELEKAISIAHYLKAKHIPFGDQYLLMLGKGKLAGAFLRVAAGLPIPKTFYGTRAVYEEIFQNENDSPLSYPLILKADNGRKGRDNYLVRSHDELLELLAKNEHLQMVAQAYIPNDGDMRVLVLAGKVRLIILRRGAAGSHLNNTSQGGKATIEPNSVLSEQMQEDCIRGARQEKLQVAGVDLIIDKETGRHYILEVNRAPQLTTGAFIDEKVHAYAEMITDLLKYQVAAVEEEDEKPLKKIGRVERLSFIDLDSSVPARIDTGAKTSAVWASDIHVDVSGALHYRLFDQQSDYFTGEEIVTTSFSETVVANSAGTAEKRYKVQLMVMLQGRKVNATFTLANRSSQVYPVLVGRNILRGKFIVDVKTGKPLYDQERKRSEDLQSRLRQSERGVS